MCLFLAVAAEAGDPLARRYLRDAVAAVGTGFAAAIHPYRKRPSLSEEEVRHLYQAIHTVFEWAIPIVAERTEDGLPLEEVRDFLRVHRRGGEPCPNCGNRITEITAGQRITSFCRHCQK